MSKLFEIINRICRRHATVFVGGFCLTGLCFGMEFLSGTNEGRLSENRLRQVSIVDGDETTGYDRPLYGQGVMFFDHENQCVRKVDAFTFAPSQSEMMNDEFDIPAAEPKKLQFRESTTVSRHDLPPDSMNDAMNRHPVANAFAENDSSTQHFPQFVSTTFHNETVVHGDATSPPVVQADATVSDVPLPFPTDTGFHGWEVYREGWETTGPTYETAIPAQPTWAPAPQLTAPTTDVRSVADHSRVNDDGHVRVAMRWQDNPIEEISTDTGDLYITHEQLDKILSEYRTGRQDVWGRKGPFTITPYGYINVSTSYESERTSRGDFALFSLSPDLDGGHSGFHVDPKSSRLGLKIDGPAFSWRCRKIDTSALVEVDFQGSNFGGTRNRGSLMLRRAFVDLTHEDTRLLIGQEWDVVSPLVPQSLNYVPGSNAGNLGYRRAQIRLERTRKWNACCSTLWQVALSDNVPADYLTDSTINIANSGWPVIQGRFAVSRKHNPCLDPFTVGISAHVGEMTHDYKAYAIDKRRHESWSANLDVDLPLTSRWRLSTELYTGTNLSGMLAGIGQGVDLFSPGSNAFDPRSADAYGGWLNLNYMMTKKFQMNVGYCVERMDDMIGGTAMGGNLYSARDKNQVLFLNGIYNWSDNFLTGLEVSQWRTDWHTYNASTGVMTDLEPGETTRIDLLVRYSF